MHGYQLMQTVARRAPHRVMAGDDAEAARE